MALLVHEHVELGNGGVGGGLVGDAGLRLDHGTVQVSVEASEELACLLDNRDVKRVEEVTEGRIRGNTLAEGRFASTLLGQGLLSLGAKGSFL
jgi:hypothetical protein